MLVSLLCLVSYYQFVYVHGDFHNKPELRNMMIRIHILNKVYVKLQRL